MLNNEEIYADLIARIKSQPLLDNGTRELRNVSIDFDPYQVLKRAKLGYKTAELTWYLSEDLCIFGHDKIEDNIIWQKCAAPNGMVNSNYGWCVFSKENGEQYKHAVTAFIRDKSSRQSCCVYTRPSIQVEHCDGVHANHDFICTYATQHMIRDDRLEYTVMMRSNDADTGLPYDLAWHQFVYHMMLQDLAEHYDVKVGVIHWYAVSLHLYERKE